MEKMIQQPLLQKAMEFAAKKHAGAFRKGTTIPYFTHVIEAMEIVSRMTEDEEIRAAAVLHDTLVHDLPSYDGAYDSSRETVKELLAEYPSVKIALDIHRDGIETAEGVRIAPVAEVGGEEAAQIMIISGCDDGTMNMPDYLNNFRFACELQSSAEALFPGLTRPILFDYRHYNQDLTDGSLLIEVGSHGNTLAQAKYSGRLIGEALGELFAQ